MIHSRPGFASRKSDQVPAKLNQDMIPALHRKPPKETKPKTLAEHLEAHKAEHQVLVNPTPDVPPQTLEPGK